MRKDGVMKVEVTCCHHRASVVVATYNRRHILERALRALEEQTYPRECYEIVVVDDGSTDDTQAMVSSLAQAYGNIRYGRIPHSGAAAARNAGLRLARGELIIFVDSDLIVLRDFVEAHLREHAGRTGLIVHGPVIHTPDPDNLAGARLKLADISHAFFATGNVSVSRDALFKAGLFNESFIEYGWEDLELGQRLKRLGLKVLRSDGPKGYHIKKAFSVADLPGILDRERQRGRMAIVYYRRWPTFKVRMEILLTPAFFGLVNLLCLGNWPTRPGIVPFLRWLEEKGHRTIVAVLVKIMMYKVYADGMKEGLMANPIT